MQTHSKQQLDEWGLLRVSENFRVVALGLPIQKYKGTPLDPPLRSRFQSRIVTPSTFHELYDELQQLTPDVPATQLKQLITFALTLQTADESIQLPDFPLHNLRLGAQMLQKNPSLTLPDVISTLYPYQSILTPEQQKRINELFTSQGVQLQPRHTVKRITAEPKEDHINVQLDELQLSLPAGSAPSASGNFVDLPHQRQVLALLLQSYAVGDICLLGEKGVGKLTLTKQLMRMLHQSTEPMMLYEDMTSRDLIQQRITNVEGDTIWRDSPLVRAAKTGSVAILNGLHRLHKSTASVLQR